MSKPLTDTEAAAVEKRIGRPLTTRERIFGELERVDNRTHGERYDAEHWQPKMAPPKAETQFDEWVRDSEKAADAERLQQLTPAQRRLAFAKDAQAQELRKRADAKAMEEHLAKHAPQLAKLRELQEAIRLDPSWDVAAAETLNRAIAQIEAGPLADPQETAKLIAAPFKILADKKQALRDQSATKRAELEATMATLDAELAAINGTATDSASNAGDEDLAASFSRIEAGLNDLAAMREKREQLAKRILGDSQPADAGATDAT